MMKNIFRIETLRGRHYRNPWQKLWVSLLLLGVYGSLYAQESEPDAWLFPETWSVADFEQITQTVLAQELQASLDALGSPETPAPDYLFGEPYGGGFSFAKLPDWITRFQTYTGKDSLGKHKLADWNAHRLPKAIEKGGNTFSQLSVGRTLLYYTGNKSVDESEYWQSLSPEFQEQIRAYMQVRKSYNPADTTRGWVNEQINGRPNNYFGVAVLIACYSWELGLDRDSAMVADLFDLCLEILERTHGFLDDNKRDGGAIDRYNFEYLRFLWVAATRLEMPEVLAKLKPWMKQSAQLWWDSFSPEVAHAAHYGRSRMNAWDDVFEQVAFYATYPELSPAPTAELAAAFALAWNHYFTYQYNRERHLNRMWDFGRAPNGYATRKRIWDYSIGMQSKLCAASHQLLEVLKNQSSTFYKLAPQLAPVNRFQVFREGTPNFGVWVYRQENIHAILPVVGTGFGSEYLPVPFGLPGIEVPVRARGPHMIPEITTTEGAILMPSQGADEVQLVGENGILLYWDFLNDKKGKRSTLPLQIETQWQLSPDSVVYTLHLHSDQALEGLDLRWHLPLTADHYEPQARTFTGDFGKLRWKATADWELYPQIQATGDSFEGKGSFQAIPLVLQFQAKGLSWKAGEVKRFRLVLRYL